MDRVSIATQVVEAIKAEDREAIFDLFKTNPEQVKAFTPFGGQTWLGYAAQTGKLNSLKALKEVGIDINLGDKRDNRRPICSAAANGHRDIVEFLLKNGAELDVSASVRNPLFSAIVGCSPNTVKLLLDAGIDCGVRYSSETMSNMDALAFALMRGEHESARAIALWNANGDEEAVNVLLAEADSIAQKNAHQ